MKTGKVTWFNDSKGYGFLECEGEQNIFVHYTAIQGDTFKTLCEGQCVMFDTIDGPKGKQAINVQKVRD